MACTIVVLLQQIFVKAFFEYVRFGLVCINVCMYVLDVDCEIKYEIAFS